MQVRLTAPVKAPFSWPNNSLSRRFSGIEAQLMATKGLELRGESRWRARARTSLPVPVSPINMTLTSIGPTRLRTCASVWDIFRSRTPSRPWRGRNPREASLVLILQHAHPDGAVDDDLQDIAVDGLATMKSKCALGHRPHRIGPRSTLPLATITLVCGAWLRISSSVLSPSLALFSSGGRPRSRMTAW